MVSVQRVGGPEGEDSGRGQSGTGSNSGRPRPPGSSACSIRCGSKTVGRHAALVSELASETFTLAPVPHLPGRAAMPRAIGLRTVLIVGRSHQQMRDRPASCPKARRGLGVEILVVGQRASGGQRRVAVRRAYELWGTERRSKGAQVTSRREWGERSTWNGGALEPWRDRDRVRTCRRSAPVRKVPRGTQDAARPTGPVGRRAGPRSWS